MSIEIFVESFTGINLYSWAKAGLMIRKSLDADSQHFSLFVTGSKGLESQNRLSDDEKTKAHQIDGLPRSNIWLKITKEGNEFQAYYKTSADTYWSTFGSPKTIDFGSGSYYYGIAVTSHDTSKIATLKVSNHWYLHYCSVDSCPSDSNLLSSEITSRTTDGSEEENKNISSIPLNEGGDSSSLEHLDEMYHPQEENVLPRSLSMSQGDVLKVKPRDQTDNVLPRLSASSSSSLVSRHFDTLMVVFFNITVDLIFSY